MPGSLCRWSCRRSAIGAGMGFPLRGLAGGFFVSRTKSIVVRDTKMTEPKTSGLIWLRPEPSGRRPRLRREQITAAALRVADAEGFEAVTMKRVATELGAGTMTLYYYVSTKAELVALMQDAILADLLIPDDELPSAWREAVTVIARRTRDVLVAHPWSIASLNDAQFGPNAMRHIEQSLAALDELDLDPGAKLSLWAIVDDYVFGSALHTIELRTRAALAQQDPQLVADAVAFGRQQFATGQFPRLAALYHQQSTPDPDAPADRGLTKAFTDQFERGLTALLDGLALSR
ncbi:TetR/AcrR family transcriptional regulator [Frankia sp. AgB1.9]|uniref:TetR/AcrR family transcriptional regulator n=1 Tax=unclassified Frankia TaxID=2632575 RepID=UPI00193361D6|nr:MULTISPECIES: TetR/AcrR family transcriptional regulator [unclassified Frankia]MBL7491976.1 TetR/AcrR family transcriptional regulator [Frankia sp. AgW1.1]MBL7548385.1 TetR/AcrR family transcriptional regulator [Frankia sp. AgB1.9]MBL7619093.1 TetR/AcrR family transcriptional regulator [Frankia sp. AgB1.8]